MGDAVAGIEPATPVASVPLVRADPISFTTSVEHSLEEEEKRECSPMRSRLGRLVL